MKVSDMEHASNAARKCAELNYNLSRIMAGMDDEADSVALYEYLREAGYFFLGVAAEVKGDD